MIELARDGGVALPTTDPDALRRFMLVDDAADLEDYLRRFDITIALLQTPEAIERVAYEMVEDAARDGLRYLEVRYCPAAQHPRRADAGRGASRPSCAASRAASGTSACVTRVINCSLRHYDPGDVARRSRELSVALPRPRAWWRSTWPAARRAGRPACTRPAFDLAAEGGLGITVHAGEAAGAESVAEAVAPLPRRPHRPRHPAVRGSGAAATTCATAGSCIEINITSNVQTRAVARGGGAPGARLLRRRARRDPLHRQLADDAASR